MIDTLIEHWKQWDEQPSNAQTVNRLEDSCILLADHLGITPTTLRVLITHLRHQGFTLDEAVNTAYDRLQNRKEGLYAQQ